jgi:predicted transcriptional regulator
MIESLPRREREVFEALCRLGEAGTSGVRSALANPLSDSAVRTLLGRLEAKRLVQRRSERGGVIYSPTPRPEVIATGVLRRMVDTFFAGSAATAATALLGMTQRLKPEEIAALHQAIDKAREREE